jgi:hypothetical protein
VLAKTGLTQTGSPEITLGGELSFIKEASDRYNELTLQPRSWTNQAQETLTFPSGPFQRDVAWPTNYYGFVDLDTDSDPTTFNPYGFFLLSIDDLNDADRDGIPDFSDDPAASVRPTLSLTSTRTNLLLEINGEMGRPYLLQRANQVPGDWLTIASLTLTNNPQTLPLPFPIGPTAFWRIQVE